mmetsp:Transcript_4399/g.5773  ORF Transcript_4399/g.5773 Transcript_4399/m.5773 type:complete len:215 (-) Transcript_4399:310-954(-)
MHFAKQFLTLSLLTVGSWGLAFQQSSLQTKPGLDGSTENRFETLPAASRRSFLEGITKKSIAAASVVLAFPDQTLASGGATAGGVYLLSAKQRYNERVKKGVVGFLALKGFLEAGDVSGLRDYFSNEDVGAWKDLTSAGYLLANAFRRSSSTAPDSLPSVKAWKKFAGEVEGMTKALKKKDTSGALLSYNNAVAALDDYLTKVDLPSTSEIASN